MKENYKKQQYMTLLEKFMSFKLRHDTSTPLDKEGWINISQLIEIAHKDNWHINEEAVSQIVKESKKQRFAIKQENHHTFIRANQGHSLDILLNLPVVSPPDILYHGTIHDFIDSIKKTGLNKQKRQHVHLSFQKDTAIIVAKRRGKDYIILEIDAKQMQKDGFKFQCSANNVWLVDHVPIKYISNLIDFIDF